MARVAVVGVGRIGLRVAWELASRGFEVAVMDSRRSALARAASVVDGAEEVLVDASSVQALARALRGFDYAVYALPGSLGPVGVEASIEAGVDGVDVSFYRDVPVGLSGPAARAGVRVLVDAGVAPGLSNMLVGMAYRELGGLEGAHILVGGVARDPAANPLGLAATWNAEDLVEEYIRPARLLRRGEVVSVDPLSSACRARLPGGLVMEAFPTDGLRSLIYTMSGIVGELVEYTLRHPGHLEILDTMRRLGLLDESPVHVDGCMVKPRAFTARLIERSTRGVEDIVVLAVKAWRDARAEAFYTLVEPEGGWSAMSRATGGFAAAALERVIAGGALREAGIHYPEEVGLAGSGHLILEDLALRGIRVERVSPGDVLVEECG